jgi:hypothetical protein
MNYKSSVKVNKTLKEKESLIIQLSIKKTMDNKIKEIQSITERKYNDEILNRKLLTQLFIKNMKHNFK